ncbi:hypothetical protein CVU75_00830 [Candidatus Dependentiae bacterium HGW-Dependentiae-1]|nr:MAG: hypothetical protein CVU75_00830 [Candidatus Dependentiae bacterium HGW-Dependentiae-1]
MNQAKKVGVFLTVWLGLVGALIYAQYVKQGESPREAISRKKIGLLITATGRYINMANELIASAHKYFCKNHEVTYFVFTDGEPRADIQTGGSSIAGAVSDLDQHAKIVKINWAQQGWPYDTLMRFYAYHQNKDTLADMDYLYAVDADMLFVAPVGDEILSDLVGARHSQLMFKRGIYDTNPLSTACVNRHEGTHYFVGAFYGGKREEFFKLLDTVTENITTDLSRGVIARVHDESHLNRYFIDHEPTLVLSPSYCHFEAWPSPYPKKLIAFDRPIHSDNKVRKHAKISPLAYLQKILKEEVRG